jgi:multidrug efflux pump
VVTPAMLMLGEKKAKRAEPTPQEPEPVAI